MKRPLLCNSHTGCSDDADIIGHYYVIALLVVVKMQILEAVIM